MGCCVTRVDGETPGGGSADAPLNQGFVIQGLVDPGMMATDPGEALVTVWSGATTQLGSVAVASYMTRVDSAVLGSTFKFTQSGIYYVTATLALGTNPVAGLLVAAGIDHTAAQRSGADGNPEPWWPQNNDNGYWFNWTAAGEIAPLKAKGPLYVSAAQAADPNLGVLRVLATDAAGSPPTVFFTVPSIASLRVQRISAAGE